MPKRIVRAVVKVKLRDDDGYIPTQVETVYVLPFSSYWVMEEARFVGAGVDNEVFVPSDGLMNPSHPFRVEWVTVAEFADREDMLGACEIYGLNPTTGRRWEAILAPGEMSDAQVQAQEKERQQKQALVVPIEAEDPSQEFIDEP